MYFLDRFSKNARISNFVKIVSLGAEFFHTDVWTEGQTDMTKLIIALRDFSNSPDKLVGSYNGMKSVYCAVRSGPLNTTV
jgi:hypothetical protein